MAPSKTTQCFDRRSHDPGLKHYGLSILTPLHLDDVRRRGFFGFSGLIGEQVRVLHRHRFQIGHGISESHCGANGVR